MYFRNSENKGFKSVFPYFFWTVPVIHIFANPVCEKTLSLWKSFPFYTQFCSYPLLPSVNLANINIIWQPLADNKNVRDPQRKHLHTFWRYQDSKICCCSLLKSLTNILPIYGWQIDWHRNSILYLFFINRRSTARSGGRTKQESQHPAWFCI